MLGSADPVALLSARALADEHDQYLDARDAALAHRIATHTLAAQVLLMAAQRGEQSAIDAITTQLQDL